MKIVVDENIPFGREAFSTIGDVQVVSGRAITSGMVQDATVLVVRSITKVDAELLQGSHVRVVGSATAGVDHIDREYLAKQGIPVMTAAGSNANSVAEYVMAALLWCARRENVALVGQTLGIIGVGHIGSLVAQKAKALGMDIILHDPPLARETNDAIYRPLNDVMQADWVTLHVPLTMEGADSTYHLFDRERLGLLAPGTTLLNTARGEVVDNQALLAAVMAERLQPPILDVWEGEPVIAWPLVSRAAVATPHIAGYSFDGKVQGTVIVYQAICEHLHLPATWVPDLPEPEVSCVVVDAEDKRAEAVLWEVVSQVYDLIGDHTRMKELLARPDDKRPAEFDRLRKTYPMRREFQWTTVSLKHGTAELRQQLEALGFGVET